MSTKRKIEDETEPTKKAKHVEEGKNWENYLWIFFRVFDIRISIFFSEEEEEDIDEEGLDGEEGEEEEGDGEGEEDLDEGKNTVPNSSWQ